MPSEKNNFVRDDFLQYVYICDSTYTNKAIIDTFSDFLWTERYYGYGEFEITMPINLEVIKNCRLKDYVMIRESDKVMIVETIGLHTDPEQGDTLTISGRSLESILERRVILDERIGSVDSDGNLEDIGVQEAIKMILSNSIIEPTDKKRKIENFEFVESEDPKIKELTITSFEDRGANVFEKISDICKTKSLGFRVSAKDGGGFTCELYFGTDRSWDQDAAGQVVFSESYENLSNSDYLQSEKDYKSIAYVEWDYKLGSSAEDKTMITEVYRTPERLGLDRREAYTRHGETMEIESTGNLSSYIKQVVDYGAEYLSGYTVTKLFDGETEPSRQFVYGIDYFLGDIVHLENKYGQSGKCRITEIIRSRNGSGVSMVPTFEIIEVEEGITSDDKDEKE